MYSFSQVQTYLKCPLQYKFRYIDEIVPPREESLELLLGKSVHMALQYLYDQVSNLKIPSEQEVVDFFVQEFQKQFATTQFEAEQGEIFENRGKVYIQNHYQRNYPFDKFKVLATEEFFNFRLPNWQIFRGFIDRIDKIWDSLMINDYKTNKRLPADEEQTNDEQIILYGYGILQKYGKQFKQVKWQLEYLHFDHIKPVQIDSQTLEQTVQKYVDVIDEIEQRKKQFYQGDQNAFEPKETSLCRFCAYKEICPLFAHWFGKVSGDDLSKESIQMMVDEYVANANKIKELKNQNEQTKKLLVEYAQKHGFLKLFGQKYQIRITSRQDYKIADKQKLKEILSKLNLLNEALEVDRYKVAKLIKSWKLDLAQLEDLVTPSEVITLRGSER